MPLTIGNINLTTLATTFAGLHLENPIIISSCGLTDSPLKNQQFSEAGAGAIVLKSLFQEQIMMEALWQGDANMYPEGSDYLVEYIRDHRLEEYLYLIRESKRLCQCPIIASINCYKENDWMDFATRIEDAGADALEINLLTLQTEKFYQYGTFEQRHIDILTRIKRIIHIPIIMKLGCNLTNPIALINQLQANEATGIVLFNRFYQPDIDIEKLAHTSGKVFSNESDFSNTLRWIGIASASIKQIDFAASGGIHIPQSIIKAILAGASAVEMCSAFYLNNSKIIQPYLHYIQGWMERHGMSTISQYKGILNVKDLKGINTFERTQFMKYFSSKT